MRNPQGQITKTMPDGEVSEADTFTCKHCDRITVVKAGARPEDIGGMCYACSGLICAACTDIPSCTPLEKRLEASERRYDTLRSYGLA